MIDAQVDNLHDDRGNDHVDHVDHHCADDGDDDDDDSVSDLENLYVDDRSS